MEIDAESRSRGARGTVLPFVMIGLTVLALLALAATDLARFAASAARTQSDAVAALHAADSGLDLYVGGVGSSEGPLHLVVLPGEATVTVTRLVVLPDASTLVALTSEGRAPRASARPIVRRVGLVVHLDPSGGRRRVVGSWREKL